MTTEPLSPEQAHALFDILSHYETYQELRDLRVPGALAHSGPPFRTTGEENDIPLVHTLFSKFIVPLPGLRDVSTGFWQAKCQEIIEEFAKADLSESYEAGYIGIRKTLATACAALVEAPARGLFGGFQKRPLSKTDGKYDTTDPEEVVNAFNDFLQRVVYENLIDELFAKAAETDNLEEHDPLVQAAHEYILVVLASFIHYIFIISPEGQTMLTMMKRANALIPYIAIRQTLKVGNAATMISGMMRIVLTKMTMNSVTSFLGITNSSDAGWNLLQTIISTVVNWDSNELKRRSTEIEKSSEGPNKAQREILKAYIDMDRIEHEKCRMMSEARAEPIVVTILDEYGGEELNEKQIPLALDYLSVHVSLRDRKHITTILCSASPDLLTQAVREGVAAYDPVIRALHNAVDLSGTVNDFQLFLDDLLKYAPSSKDTPVPSVGDFVQLLRKHQGSCHSFIHQICKNGPELSNWYKVYAKNAVASFQVKEVEATTTGTAEGAAGNLTPGLNKAVSKLSEAQRAQVIAECDAHATYLTELSTSSKSNMKFDISIDQPTKKTKKAKASKPSTRDSSPVRHIPGPGMFLRRWQAYVNETSITPAQIDGPVRHGDDIDVINAGRVPSSGVTKIAQVEAAKDKDVKAVPSCEKTVELLGGRFRELLKGSGIVVSQSSC